MDQLNLDEYADYWTEDFYVLVASSDTGVNQRPHYSIIDVERHMYCLIEDSALQEEIVKKMIAKGVKIYKDIRELPPKTIAQHWTPGKEMYNFYEAINSYNFTEKQVDKLFRHFIGKDLGVDEVRQKIEQLMRGQH